MVKIFYHYKHYLPGYVVHIEIEKCLKERVLETLKKDSMILIDEIKEEQ